VGFGAKNRLRTAYKTYLAGKMTKTPAAIGLTGIFLRLKAGDQGTI